jgi:hypothetical protein
VNALETLMTARKLFEERYSEQIPLFATDLEPRLIPAPAIPNRGRAAGEGLHLSTRRGEAVSRLPHKQEIPGSNPGGATTLSPARRAS